MQKALRLFLLLTLFLSACSPAAPAANSQVTATAPGQAQVTSQVQGPAPTETSAAQPATKAPTALPATEAVTTPTAASLPTAAVKEHFVATDPATVNLAAGKPQLVEFFAVW
jgi:hypothetical protein